MSDESRDLVTNKDRNVSAIKAALKLIPGGVGEAMIQFYWGKGEEARQRRLDETIEAIAAKLAADGESSKIDGNEDFGNFFSKAAGPIANATNEDKRQRFRDLLYNSMLLPPGEAGWEDSMHCLELLQKIDPVGLYCLARIARAEQNGESVAVARFTGTAQWVTIPRSKLQQNQPSVTQEGKFEDFQYNDVLVTRNLKKIQDEYSLVNSRNVLVSVGGSPGVGGGFATGVDFYSLSPEEQLLVKWTIADF